MLGYIVIINVIKWVVMAKRLVDFGVLGSTYVEDGDYYSIIRRAALKLGLAHRFNMSYLAGLASVSPKNPKRPGGKKLFDFREPRISL